MTAEHRKLRVAEGIDEKYVDDALRVAYYAFAKKFRFGFRSADDLIRLFRDSVDTTSCFSSTVDGKFSGILTFQTVGRVTTPRIQWRMEKRRKASPYCIPLPMERSRLHLCIISKSSSSL